MSQYRSLWSQVVQPRKHKRLTQATYRTHASRSSRVTFHRAGEEGFHQGKLMSLSPAGLFVRTSYIPPAGTRLFLEFHFLKKRIRLLGKVIYTNSIWKGFRPQGFGVKFYRMYTDDFEVLKSGIEAIAFKTSVVRF